MKPHICSALFVALFLGIAGTPGGAKCATNRTYVIPVEGMIERGLEYVVRRCIAQAEREGAQAIVFMMDTPGGRVDAAEAIMHVIGGVEIPTYTLVNPDAISAGAMIAMSTDHIYMTPGSRIGDAMPIMMSMFGSPAEMSEGMEEKSVSYVSSLIRSAAQRKGHDAKLAEAMVRREMEYRIDDLVICPSNQLLTLTNVEAERIVTRDGEEGPLLSKGTVEDLAGLLAATGQEGNKVVEFNITPTEKIARFIEMFSALFLIGGLLGIYIEFKTPGFGVPGLSGIALLSIWFWGHHIAGLAGMGEIVLFMLGTILLAVEIFAIPGFGITGIAGISLMVLAMMMAMVQHAPNMPVFDLPTFRILEATRNLGISIVGSFALMALLARYLPETRMFQRIMLTTSLDRESGCSASSPTGALIGATGTAGSDLRPAGIASIDGKRVNVVARGTFVAKGTPIVVAETHGNRIVVDIAPERPHEAKDGAADGTEDTKA
jgi:membrane-bound serine protease (ClpP class)